MSIQEPAWLKRTRPCPFFSQGRCLFADSCNFLHDVKVRNAVHQPLLSTTLCKQPSLSPKPPSVVVNSASPRSVDPASPQSQECSTQDSSRYSGLLSVLSDVIGPPTTTGDAVPVSQASSTSSSVPHGCTSLASKPRSFGLEPTGTIAKTGTGQSTSGRAEPSSFLEPGSEATSVDPSEHQTEPSLPEADVAVPLLVPNEESPAQVDTTSNFVEGLETYVIGSDDEDEDTEGSTVMLSNRQSTFSSFTGASLLASPRHSVSGEPSVTSPTENSVAHLLSPVPLSAELRPFPISSSGSKIKREDSIDSGYADGACWVSPLPFPRSPPRSFRSPVTFPSDSRRTSLSSPALEERRTSYNVNALRPLPHNPIEAIKSDGRSEDNEDVALTILGAYDVSPSEEQSEDGACDPLQVNVVEEKANEDDKPPEVSGPPRDSAEHLCPTRTHYLGSYDQPCFISDDNLSFKTALSTQHSHEDWSNISRISPAKQNSLLSSVLGCSISSISASSRYDDANESLDQSIAGSPVCESYGQSDSIKALVSEGCPLLEEVAVNSNVQLAPVSTSGLEGLSPERVVTPRGSLSDVLHSDRRSLTSSLSVDASHNRSSAKDVLGRVLLATPEKDATWSVFHFDKRLFKSSPGVKLSSVSDAFPPIADDYSPENIATLRERFPGVLHHDRRSPGSDLSIDSYNASSCESGDAPTSPSDIQESQPQRHSSGPESSLFAASPRSPSFIKGVLRDASPDADRRHDGPPVNGVVKQERTSSFDNNLPKLKLSAESSHSSSPVKNVLVSASPRASDAQEFISEHAITSQERLSCVLRFVRLSPKLNLSMEDSHILAVKDVLGHAPPDANSTPLKPLPASRAECAAAEGSQSTLDVEDSDETAGFLNSGSDNFAQRSSFPLPPDLPSEFARHSTLSGGDTSLPTGPTITNIKKDVSNACAAARDANLERTHSDSSLTEKAMPSQLPSVGYTDFDTSFTLRRSRAASDLTVKGRSPPTTTPGDTPRILSSPTPPLEEPGPSDSVQSLYDQYFSDDDSDGGSESSNLAHEHAAPPDMSGSIEEPPLEDRLQPLDLTPHAFQEISPSGPHGEVGDSCADSPRSEIVLRPLLTGRRSSSCSSRVELIPKANPSSHSPTRLQTREIGSTIVPLSFRRHKPQPASTQPSLHTAPAASELREVLRIRTDIAREYSLPGCFSASHVPSTTWSPLPVKAMSAPPTGGLRQLHLSSIIHKRSSILSTHSSSIASSILTLDHLFNSPTRQSPSVSSTTSFSRNSSLSSLCEQIPEQMHHTLKRSSSNSFILQANNNDVHFASQSLRDDSRSVSTPSQQPYTWCLSHYRAGSRNYTPVDGTRRVSKRTSTLSLSYTMDEEQEINEPNQSKHADDWTRPASRPASVLTAPIHAIATPKPNLLFAIASDDVDQVRQVLESGEAGPNDSIGPQSALAFTLTNNKLAHKQDIVKALLAYGANPSALRNPALNPASRREEGDGPNGPPPETTLEGMDPATRYFVARADAAHTRQTSQLIYRSFFHSLTRVRYDVIGQDWALEQLFRVLSTHSHKLAVAPIVVLLCGPSGHGKSLLARKFGSLLDVPTHTVNMTTLRSTHDIWQSYSMSPYEEPSSCTLAEFLIENEGKRCVVVLDEIEKVENQKALWSLLMPWELGRCSLEAGKRHVDARNVIWIGTSNIGHELVFEYHENRAEPDNRMSREDYLELTSMLRPRVSHCLGASLISRITTVLPFVPFTLDEKKAIAAEAVYTFAGDASRTLSPRNVESLVTKALPSYQPSEGARSLHRAISNILINTI